MPELPPAIPLCKRVIIKTVKDVRGSGFDFTWAQPVMDRVEGNFPLSLLKRFPYGGGMGEG
jgi:hypothetical protein